MRAGRMMPLTASRGFGDVPLFVCDAGVAGLSLHIDAVITALPLLDTAS